MNDHEINDIREAKEFQGFSFSQFKKGDAKKELFKNLYNGKIEPACYWSAELICAGHYVDLWNVLIEYYTKHIHIGNPKIVIYLDFRIGHFKEIVRNGYRDQELRLRNSDKIRKLFGEIICVLCDAKKRHCYEEVKVKKEDFDLTQLTERFQAPSMDYANAVFLKDDPKELFVAANELAYHLTEEGKNSVSACYWIGFIIQFDLLCRQKKETIQCERRIFAAVEPKLQMDVGWIIWDIFLAEARKRDNPLLQRLIQSALNIFCLRYSSGCYKKRIFLIYFVVELFTEPFSTNEEMSSNKNKIKIVMQNIHKIYKQIKQHEHSPDTDYLYQNLKSTNLENTIRKLEAMDNFNTDFVPRIDG